MVEVSRMQDTSCCDVIDRAHSGITMVQSGKDSVCRLRTGLTHPSTSGGDRLGSSPSPELLMRWRLVAGVSDILHTNGTASCHWSTIVGNSVPRPSHLSGAGRIPYLLES